MRALDAAAAAAGRRHGVLLMIDLGDLREGMMPRELDDFVDSVLALDHVDLVGVGTNLTCYGAIIPTPDNLGRLVQLAARAAERAGRPLLVSGGNSSSLDLAFAEGLPGRHHQPAHRREHPAGRQHHHARSHRGPAPGRVRAGGAGDRMPAEAVDAHRGDGPGCLRPTSAVCGPGASLAGHLRGREAGHRAGGTAAAGSRRGDPGSIQRPSHPRRAGHGPSRRAWEQMLRFVPGYGALLLASTSPYVDKVLNPPA